MQSYQLLSTLTLPTSSVLHPEACNPAMDLVALLSPAAASSKPGAVKGTQGHAVTLWRLSGGPRVWTKDVEGMVEGMGWSPDGLQLALYVRKLEEGHTTLEIFSVHDGERLHSIEAPRCCSRRDEGKGKGREDDWQDVLIRWQWTTDAPEPLFGSALSVIAALPHLRPHEPPPPPTTHSFLPLSLPGAASTPREPVEPSYLNPSLPRLAHSVLPPLPPEAPRASLLKLTLGEYSASFPFLSGTYPLSPFPAPAIFDLALSSPPPAHAHALAQTATALEELLRYLAVGVSNLSNGWIGKNGGGTATRQWVTSIADALRQHGEDGDVRRALGTLLMTGRPGEGLMNFFGGKLTPRSLSKWEMAVLTSLTDIRQTCFSDLTPAIERVILLLQDLHGWSLWPEQYGQHLRLDARQIEQALGAATALAHGILSLEQRARDEHHRFSHFSFWLAYELAVAAANASQDSAEDDPLLEGRHNVLLVADFIQSSLLSSSIDGFFDVTSTTTESASAQDVLNALDTTSEVVAGAEAELAGLQDLVADLKDIVAHPSPTSCSPTVPQEPSLVAGARLKSRLLSHRSPNASRGRLRSPAKQGPQGVVDALSAMDESDSMSVDISLSLSMEMDQSTTSAGQPQHSSSSSSLATSKGAGNNSVVAAPDVAEAAGSLNAAEVMQQPAKKQAYALPLVMDALVGAVRSIVGSALQVSDPSATPSRPASLKLPPSCLLRSLKVEEDAAQLALIAGGADSHLCLFKRLSDETLFGASFATRCQLVKSDDDEPQDVEVLDMGFFTADEFVLVLSEKAEEPKIYLASVDLADAPYTQLAPPPKDIPFKRWLDEQLSSHHLPRLPQVPLFRVRHLSSLDRLPRPASDALPADHRPLVSLALNGNKGRMTGSLLSWGGREMVVFDLAGDEDEEDEDEDDMAE